MCGAWKEYCTAKANNYEFVDELEKGWSFHYSHATWLSLNNLFKEGGDVVVELIQTNPLRFSTDQCQKSHIIKSTLIHMLWDNKTWERGILFILFIGNGPTITHILLNHGLSLGLHEESEATESAGIHRKTHLVHSPRCLEQPTHQVTLKTAPEYFGEPVLVRMRGMGIENTVFTLFRSSLLTGLPLHWS